MGGCWFFNVLLGMSVVGVNLEIVGKVLCFGVSEFFVVGGIGVYIVGVIWFVCMEVKCSNWGLLLFGFVVMIVGIVMLVVFFYFFNIFIRFLGFLIVYGFLLFGLVGVVVVCCCIDVIVCFDLFFV